MSKDIFFCRYPAKEDASNEKIHLCRFVWLEHWHYSASVLSCWAFYWNQDPGAWLIFDGQKINLNPDSICLIPPYTHFSTDNISPFRHFYIHFTMPSPFDHVQRKPLLYSVKEMRTLLQNIMNESNDTRFFMNLKIILYQYLLQIPKDNFLPPDKPALDPRICRVIERMEQDLRHVPDNRELSRKAGMSLPKFYELFSKELGVSPKQYMQQQKMELARQLLSDPSVSIEEIAERTGFADRFHFSKTFRLFNPVSPVAYRKALFDKNL